MIAVRFPELVEMFPVIPGGHWIKTKDGDPLAAELFKRHYSYHQYKDNRRSDIFYRNRNLIGGPGEKYPLVTANYDALFFWRKFRDDSGQVGVNCSIFRNESNLLSSDLIKEACSIAWLRWPGERLYTTVDPTKIRSSNPGCCYIKAGWRKCGITKVKKLIILEKLPC